MTFIYFIYESFYLWFYVHSVSPANRVSTRLVIIDYANIETICSHQGAGADQGSVQGHCGVDEVRRCQSWVEPSLPIEPPVKLEGEVESASNWKMFLGGDWAGQAYFPQCRTGSRAGRFGGLQKPNRTPWWRVTRPGICGFASASVEISKMHLDKVDPADEVGNQAGEDGGENVKEDKEE